MYIYIYIYSSPACMSVYLSICIRSFRHKHSCMHIKNVIFIVMLCCIMKTMKVFTTDVT